VAFVHILSKLLFCFIANTVVAASNTQCTFVEFAVDKCNTRWLPWSSFGASEYFSLLSS